MMALVGLGNRAAGQEGFGTYIGVAIMTLGVYFSHPIWWAVPLIYAALLLWRLPSPEPWYHIPQGTGTWQAAFDRGVYVYPFSILLTLITRNPIHLLTGFIVVGLFPVAYWLGFKYKAKPVELSELLAGAIIGLI